MLKNCAVCNKEFKAKGKAKTCGRQCNDLNHKAYMNVYMKAYRQTPEQKAYIKAYRQTPENKTRKNTYMKSYRQTPQYKAYMKGKPVVMKTCAECRKIMEVRTSRKTCPGQCTKEYRRKMGLAYHRKQYANPYFREQKNRARKLYRESKKQEQRMMGKLDPTTASRFIDLWNAVASTVYRNAVNHGFWESDRSDPETIALIHSELSETLESIRHDHPPDPHCPEFTNTEVELADVVIRIMDLACRRDYRVAEALIAKHEYNRTREYKHGKSF